MFFFFLNFLSGFCIDDWSLIITEGLSFLTMLPDVVSETFFLSGVAAENRRPLTETYVEVTLTSEPSKPGSPI